MADPFETDAEADAFLAGLKAKGEGVDYFLKLEGIEGDSADSKHKGELEVSSWSWFEAQLGGGKSATAGKVAQSVITAQLYTGKASPRLFLACAKREKIPKAELSCRRAGASGDHMKVRLTGVKVLSYQQTPVELAVDNSIHVMDVVFFRCESFELEYKEEQADGALGAPIKAGFNFDEQKPL